MGTSARWRFLVATALFASLLTACNDQVPVRKPDLGAAYLFDGWGISLAWWANIVGGWPTATGTPDAADFLFGDPTQTVASNEGPVHPLGLNVVRYNIGASPVTAPAGTAQASGGPTCDAREFGYGKAIPSPQQGAGLPVVLAMDARQVSVLQQAVQLIRQRSAGNPADVPVVQAFANAPAWWLVGSDACAAMGTPNRSAPVDPTGFADYLVRVVQALRTQAGIDVSTLEPFNEPWSKSGWWSTCTQNCQEGANFDVPAQQDVVHQLCDALRQADPPVPTTLAVNDGNSPSDTAAQIGGDLAESCVTQIDTHSYAEGTDPYEMDRTALRRAATGKQLWMSEFGADNSDPKHPGRPTVAIQIADDLQQLRPSAWVYWQAVDNAWGLLAGPQPLPGTPGEPTPPSDPVPLHVTPDYQQLAQYTRFIRPGDCLLPLGLPDSGAYNAQDPGSEPVRATVAQNRNGQVVVSAVNADPSSQHTLKLDLGALGLSGTGREYAPDASGGTAETSVQPVDGVLSVQLDKSAQATYVLPARPAALCTGKSQEKSRRPPPTATVLQTYDPWVYSPTGGAAPAPGLTVTTASGSCDSGSQDDPGRAGAFRCIGNGTVCFVDQNGDPGSPVLCSSDPTSRQVTLVTLTADVPVDRANPDDPGRPPWVLTLADGRTCRFQGYGTGAESLPYDCGDGTGTSAPDRSQPAWTVREADNSRPGQPSGGTTVAVVTAYR